MLRKVFDLFLIIFIIVFSTCDTKDDQLYELQDFPIVFNTSVYEYSEIKSSTASWKESDKIGVFAIKNGAVLQEKTIMKNYDNFPFSTTRDGRFIHDVNPIYYPKDGSAVDFISYYPYDSNIISYNYPIDITKQIDFLYSNNLKNATNKNRRNSLEFKRVLSKIIICVETELDFTVEINGVKTKADFSLANGEFIINDKSTGILSLTPTNTDDKKQKEISCFLLPTTESNSIEIVFKQNDIILEELIVPHVLEAGMQYNFDLKLNNSDGNNKGLKTMYVAPNPIGLANGLSEDNAADFLNASFWIEINEALINDSVEVKFLAGTYSRAYMEKAFRLFNIGSDNNNWLILSGNEGVVFPALEGYPEKSVMMDITGCENLIISDFHFTGNGRIGYVTRVSTTNSSKSNNNIIFENCTWKDMRGVVYGATGAHNRTKPTNVTTNITYRDCTFARIGIDGHSHHMYHAHNASKIKIMNCHFEDCTGDYVRFRDGNDFIIVKNCVFIHNDGFDTRHSPFLAVPLFNSRAPVGDEYFATNYVFTGNEFITKPGVRTNYAIYFGNWGFSPPDYSYLLTAEEGSLLKNGSKEERSNLLDNNFGIDVNKIRIANNTYTGAISNKLVLRSYASSGAVSMGWEGTESIFDLINDSETPFEWEGQIGSD